MNIDPAHAQSRRICRTAFLFTGTLLAATGAVHAQTYATTVVAPTQVQVFQFSTTTTTSSPTYNRAAITTGVNALSVYSTTNPAASSGIGSSVAYATSGSFTPTASGSYTVSTTATGYDPGTFIQYVYQPALVPTTATTALQGVKYGFYNGTATNSGSYNISLTGASPYQFVNTGYYSNDSRYPQVPGNGLYSEGTVSTTVVYNNPGSTSFIPDNSPVGVSQILNVSSANYVSAFNSITIDGLKHTALGDLTATLSHNGITVDLFDHTGADNNPADPGYNYGQGSQAFFDGKNYTFSLSGASLAAVQDYTNAPDGTTFAAAGNATGGFDTANAANTLNSFLGQTAGGAWTLSIQDRNPDDIGSFTGFSFNINSAPVPEASSAVSLALLFVFGAGGLLYVRRSRATA